MANVSRVRGLRPVKHYDGSPFNGQGTTYHIPASEANNIAIGDPVKLLGTADSVGVADVGLAGTGDVIVGVVIGVKANPLDLNHIYRAAGVDTYVIVADSMDVLYEVQANGVVATTQIGLNANFTNGGVSTAVGVSGVQLDASTLATTATLPLKVVGAVQSPDNDITSTNAKFLVMINRHQFANQVAGV